MDSFNLLQNYDGTYTLVIYLKSFNYEFGQDFFGKDNLKNRVRDISLNYKNILIKTVKFVLVGGIVISVPFAKIMSGSGDNGKFAMSYVYFGTVAGQIENVKKSAKVIDTVSPSYFDLNEKGELNISNLSVSFVEEMHKEGLKVVPFISNHWSRSVGNAALDNRYTLAQDIAETVDKYNLDGAHVDIENVDHTYRDKYTDFVRVLRELLPADKEVSVAVAANPYGWTNGWQGSYDYAALAKHADYLMIMSYDEHYEGGEPGAVASIDFVRESIEYALEYVSEEKIVMGVPFFGRLWGGGLNGSGISLNRAQELIETYGAKIYFDQETMSPVATFTVRSSYPSFNLNGKTLKPGNYTLWYEDENSLREKFRLIEEYGIKGVGNWSAGQEKDGIWDYYELWMSGIYFNDIIGHFAKDDIIKVYSEGIMLGKSGDSFEPGGKLTRGEAAVVLARVLGLSPVPDSKYKDTKGHFAAGYINALAEAGLTEGYPDGTFRPDNVVSRQEMAVLLARIAEPDYRGKGGKYMDVDKSLWSFAEISALTEAGIMQGYADGTFRPHNPVTRGEMAVLINRIEKKQ